MCLSLHLNFGSVQVATKFSYSILQILKGVKDHIACFLSLTVLRSLATSLGMHQEGCTSFKNLLKSQNFYDFPCSYCRKYERCKAVIESLKQNEDVLKASVQEYDAAIKKQENKYEMLKQHAKSQLEK